MVQQVGSIHRNPEVEQNPGLCFGLWGCMTRLSHPLHPCSASPIVHAHGLSMDDGRHNEGDPPRYSARHLVGLFVFLLYVLHAAVTAKKYTLMERVRPSQRLRISSARMTTPTCSI